MDKTDLNQLRWFQLVAEEHSFTRAAAKIGVAQSTLSYAIKQLEDRMGVRLLVRTTRNVATTAAGERLLQTITPRIAHPQDLVRHVCINMRHESAGGLYAWEFEKTGRSCASG